MSFHLWTLVFVLAFAASCTMSTPSAGSDDRRLLIGFETDELKAKTEGVWGDMSVSDAGCEVWVQFEHGERRSRAWTWSCRKGEATEGEQSLVARIGPGRRQRTFEPTPFQQRYYPALRANAEAAVIFNTFQWLAFSKVPMRDWSGADVLRVDVQADRALPVRLCVEDETIEPPIVSRVEVPAGKWVTVELDLKKAVERRGLDLANMTNVFMLGEPAERTVVRVDNVRLARKDAPAKLPVLRDDASMRVERPDFPRTPEVPKPQHDFTPDRSTVTLESPVEVVEGSVVPFGFLAAADNRRMLLAYTTGSNRGNQVPVVVESTDGGTTWQRLPAPMARNFDHGTSRGSVLSARGDAVSISSGPGCAGIGVPTPRQHLTKYTFTGKGWQCQPTAILDYDIRHCGSAAWVIRLTRGPHAGRLWASWGSLDRMRRLVVHGKSSDDDGRTWWFDGKSPMVPDSAEKPLSLNSYSYQQPRCTYFRGHVAVFWQDQRGLRWSRYDGKSWSPAESIQAEAAAKVAVSENESFRVPGSCVTIGEDEIFLTAWNVPGVLHYRDGKWTHELTDAPDAGSLTVCGDRDVMLITMGHTEEPPPDKRIQITRKTNVLAWRRKPDDTWAEPLDLAGGEVTLHEYRQMTGVVVPPGSPPNFAPVAFSDDKTVRLVKVPTLGTGD